MRRASIVWACALCCHNGLQGEAFQTAPQYSSTLNRSHRLTSLTRDYTRQSLSFPRPLARLGAENVDSEGGSGDSGGSDPKLPSRLRTVWEYLQRKQQYPLVLILYVFHLCILTQKEAVFPVQLIPSTKGHFTGIGYDSLAGIVALIFYQVCRRRSQQSTAEKHDMELPSVLSSPSPAEAPWNLPRDNARFRLTSIIAAFVLVQAYFATGRFSIFWEDTLYAMSGLGFPITAPMQRSLCVLLGHLSWLLTGSFLLRWLPRPPKFFQPASSTRNESKEDAGERNHVWFQSSRQSKWVWWVIGGYFVSSWLFNVADLVNQYILPAAVLEEAQESVVSQLVNPEHNDWLASAVGYIAPCITAPWWEEILYRGFALSGLSQLFGYRWAVFLQGVIFSAHHMSLSAALPLAVLGWTWGILYTKSRNLWTVIVVHSLWNSRVFLGSWLGL